MMADVTKEHTHAVIVNDDDEPRRHGKPLAKRDDKRADCQPTTSLGLNAWSTEAG